MLIAGETSDVTCSIQVSSLPPNISEELIADFFENSKRSGGGDVEYVAYDETNKTAIITFQNPTGYFQYFVLILIMIQSQFTTSFRNTRRFTSMLG